MNAAPNPFAYEFQPQRYAEFAEKSFSWLHIERPALDNALAEYYEKGDDIRVLDVGCGSGRVINHLITRGIPPENITGVDPSTGLLLIAAEGLPRAGIKGLPPEVGLVGGSAAEMPFSDESFHLVVANMVLNAMDNNEAEATIKQVSRVLVPGGDFFFIDDSPTPDFPKNSWRTVRSPWDADLDVFDHDMEVLLHEVAPRYGLTCLRAEQLEADEAGRAEDPAEYARYSSGHFRLSVLLHKAE
jgi:ubiquinone/menaquinone biosynthesis C-methylase UbiE